MKYLALIIGIFSYIYLNFSTEAGTESTMNAEPFAVVELFTSEGCYSCPPADRLLSTIIKDSRNNDSRVFALAFHVDYWDRLGWKDAYSDSRFSERQKDYAYSFKTNSVYTPQMIVNGSAQFVGSDTEIAYKNINNALEVYPEAEIKLSYAFNRDMDMVTIKSIINGDFENTVANFALVERGIIREIGHGENGGKTLNHDNVVRAFEVKNSLKNTSHVFDIPDDLVIGNSSLIVYLQKKQTREIVGAQRIDLN